MGALNLQTLKTRFLSALLIGPLFLFLTYWGGIVFAGILGIALGVAAFEARNMFLKWPVSGIPKLSVLMLGIIYLLGSFYCFYLLRDNYPTHLTFLFLILVWGSDIGAYFTGKLIGGFKPFPGISPNKTVGGFAGAMLFPALLAVIWTQIFKTWPDHYSAFDIIGYSAIMGLIVGLIGQCGDLLMSFAKRQAGVKDTGNLIPGHGGLLDRIDSMMSGAPVFLFLVYLVFHGGV